MTKKILDDPPGIERSPVIQRLPKSLRHCPLKGHFLGLKAIKPVFLKRLDRTGLSFSIGFSRLPRQMQSIWGINHPSSPPPPPHMTVSIRQKLQFKGTNCPCFLQSECMRKGFGLFCVQLGTLYSLCSTTRGDLVFSVSNCKKELDLQCIRRRGDLTFSEVNCTKGLDLYIQLQEGN